MAGSWPFGVAFRFLKGSICGQDRGMWSYSVCHLIAVTQKYPRCLFLEAFFEKSELSTNLILWWLLKKEVCSEGNIFTEGQCQNSGVS
jgi:hypothetical protein